VVRVDVEARRGRAQRQPQNAARPPRDPGEGRDGCAPNTVFVGRRPTGEVYTPELRRRFPQRDWILTRILWLSGTEVGRNRLGNVDTMRRYIYIHGMPDTEPLGVPGSIGCVRMRNADLIELYDLVPAGTVVDIA
jgi:L,D-transpeptidase YbiS